jgi:transcriptional regulator with XRE-family HTH domain
MTQDELATATGIDRGTVNGYCTGRLDLGPKNAAKIAAVLDISVLELGAPEEAADAPGQTLLARLGTLEETAVRVSDLAPVWRILRLLASGDTGAAQRALSEMEAQAR